MPNEESFIKKVFVNVANAITNIGADEGKDATPAKQAKEPEFVLELADELLGDSIEISGDTSKAEQTKAEKEAKEIVQDMLTKLFNEDAIKKLADKDSDGITLDEAREYLASIAGNDSDAQSLSIEDIEKALDELGIDATDILNEKVRELFGDKETEAAEKAKEAEAAEQAQVASSSPEASGTSGAGSSSGAGGSGMGSSSGVSGAGSSSGVKSSDTNNTENMSVDEIKAEIQTKETELSKFQEELSAITDGSDPDIKALEEAEEKAYQEYQQKMEDEAGFFEGAIDGANPKTINEEKENVDKAQNDLDKNQADTIAQQGKLDSANSKITNCEAKISSLDASIASIQEAINSAEEGKDTSDLQAKLSAAQQEKQAAEQEKQAAETERDTAQKEIERLTSEKTTLEKKLKESQDKLTELQNKYEEKHPEVKEAREAWEKAKEAVQAKKEEKMQAVQENIKTTQGEIDKLNQQLTEAQNAENEKKYSAKTASTELNEGIMKGALAGQEELIVQIADEYGIEPEFFAAIIGLESGWGTSSYAQNNYNYGGVTGSGDAGYTTRASDGYKFAKYSSPEAGLRAMAKNLASYPDRYPEVKAVNFENVNQIGSHYCPGGEWPGLIAGTYKTIKKA